MPREPFDADAVATIRALRELTYDPPAGDRWLDDLIERMDAGDARALLRPRFQRGAINPTKVAFVDMGNGLAPRWHMPMAELDGRSFDLGEVLVLLIAGRPPVAVERMRLQAAQSAREAAAKEADDAHRRAVEQAHAERLSAVAARAAVAAAQEADETDAAPEVPEDATAAPEPLQRPVRYHRDAEALLADGKVVGNPELRDVAPALEQPHEGAVTYRSRDALRRARQEVSAA